MHHCASCNPVRSVCTVCLDQLLDHLKWMLNTVISPLWINIRAYGQKILAFFQFSVVACRLWECKIPTILNVSVSFALYSLGIFYHSVRQRHCLLFLVQIEDWLRAEEYYLSVRLVCFLLSLRTWTFITLNNHSNVFLSFSREFCLTFYGNG